MTRKIKKIENGVYVYRGYEIVRDDSVPSGCWGRWKAYLGGKLKYSDLRSDIVSMIDQKLQNLEDMERRS